MTDLLEQDHQPCPWCGSTNQIGLELGISSQTGWHCQVACADCRARGPERCSGNFKTAQRLSMQAWNGGWEPSETD